jgi:hypothetical protein
LPHRHTCVESWRFWFWWKTSWVQQ